ncbi:hypothetical protein AAC387_Pa03g4430 [Persea americana]
MRDGTQVAVKMLSEESIKMLAHPSQFSIQFQTEVQIQTRIHHRNLVPFIGNRGKCKKAELGPATENSFASRLRIGLEYLHSGCKPKVIHRDVKTTNILLSGRLEVKIRDFGVWTVQGLPPRGLNSCIHYSQRHTRLPRSRVLHY